MNISNARSYSTLVLVVLGVAMLWGPASGAQSSGEFKLVVHISNGIEDLPAKTVSRIFLRKLTRWDNGSKITPVQPATATAARIAFSTTVHGRSVNAVHQYWRTEIYSGRSVPPQEHNTDTEIIDAVSTNPNAIGYVSAQTPLGQGVRAVRIAN